MDFNKLYNPKRVYEGFFETYFIRPFVHQYADFHSQESSRDCLLSLLAWFIISLGIVGIMMGQVGIIGPDSGIAALIIICTIWGIASLPPIVAVIARTKNGAPNHNLRPRILGIDTLLGVSCLLFFVLGLLMMVTTLDSGQLNPNARIYDETDTTAVEDEYVKEEPIFTYQEDVSPAESDIDSTLIIDEVPETDEYSPEESFDPTIAPPLEDSLN